MATGLCLFSSNPFYFGFVAVMSPDLQGYVAVVDRCIDRSVMKAFEDHPLIVLSTLVSTLSSFSEWAFCHIKRCSDK